LNSIVIVSRPCGTGSGTRRRQELGLLPALGRQRGLGEDLRQTILLRRVEKEIEQEVVAQIAREEASVLE
jgi:hypothetical protein